MAKIHDWVRIYWRNASGDREYFMEDDLTEDDVAESVRCIYQNEHGDTVAYRIADEDADHEHKYEVTFNGGVIEDYSLEGWEGDEDREAEGELAAFDTRGTAREFAAQWRREHGSPEDLGYPQYERDELEEMDYQDELRPLAQEHGIRADQSQEDLVAQLSGEEPAQLKNEQKAPAE